MLLKMIALALWVTKHLALLMAMLLAATSLSYPLTRKVGFHSRLERWLFTPALGLGLASLLLFILGLVGWLRREIIIAATVVGVVSFLVQVIRAEGLDAYKKIFVRPSLSVVQIILSGGFFGYWLLLLAITFYPPMEWDATMYHLPLARQYLTDHKILAQPGAIFPVLPLLNHQLFVWALALSDDILAQMIEHLFLVFVALGLFAWGQRQHSAMLGMAAAAFWLAHPLVLWLAQSAYVEMGLACFMFLGVYALRVWWDEKDKLAWWFLGMAMLSFAAGTKIPGLVFMPLAAALGILAVVRRWLAPKHLLIGFVIALVLGSPWYLWIGSVTGNPLWPMFARFSQGLWGDASVVRSLSVWIELVGVPKTPLNFCLIPFYFVLQPAKFLPDNNLPLFPLICLIPITWFVAIWQRSVRWWTLWALAFTVSWFLSSQQVRLWIPTLPLVSLALVESGQWIGARFSRWQLPVRLMGMAFILGAFMFGSAFAAYRILKKGRLPITPTQRQEYLASRWGHFGAVNYVNQHWQPEEAVYTVHCSWVNYYFNARVVDSAGLVQQSLRPAYQWPDDELWLKWIESQRVGWIVMSAETAPQTIKAMQDVATAPELWPGWKLVYADQVSRVFKRVKP